MNETVLIDGIALGEAYRAGRRDPRAVADEAIARAERAGAVFIAVLAARARREAERSWRRWRDDAPSSPLDGVPIAWKDLFDMAGTATTGGSAFRRDAPPAPIDAPLVADLCRAGLVAIGKTNLSELAFSGLGLNPHYGTPPHPFLPGAVPGGSSSGSAVAVASGIVPLAIGTDTAGSVRVPAAFNGLVGYRPSHGRYSLDGALPLAPSFDTAGPFARSVRDVRALDAILTGDAPADATEFLPGSVAGRRFVLDETMLADPTVTEPVRTAIERAVERLRAAGAMVERRVETTLAAARRVLDRDGWLGAAEAFAVHEALLASTNADRLDPMIRDRLRRGGTMTTVTALRLGWTGRAMRARLAAELDGAVLLLPAVGHAPPPLAGLDDADTFARVNLAALRLSTAGSFLGMPGIVLPCGRLTGLLLSAPDGDDLPLFRAASAVEAVLGDTFEPAP